MSQALQTDRQEATETNALLLAVISNIDLAVFTFDQENRLRLVNDTGIKLLNRQSQEILGSTAAELGLEECLQGNRTGVLRRSFPGSFGTRWEIRRSAFRQQGRPHQLLVLSDLSQTLREEERRAWQRLIRVLGHELNNSLGPIQSISDSLGTVARRDQAVVGEEEPEDDEEDDPTDDPPAHQKAILRVRSTRPAGLLQHLLVLVLAHLLAPLLDYRAQTNSQHV